MTALDALATRWLEARDHVVLGPNLLTHDDEIANVGPYTIIRRTGPYKVVPMLSTVLPTNMRAVLMSAQVVPPGYVATRLERVPDVGSVHTPMIGQAETRTVVSVIGEMLTYRSAQGERTCKVRSFNEWCSEKQAKAVG